jgi:hypothetical protein
MVRVLLIVALPFFTSAVSAQPIPLHFLSVESVLHEPRKSDAGDYLSGLLDGDGDPVIGNGKRQGQSSAFYARRGRTTHDLCVIANSETQDYEFDINGSNQFPQGLLALRLAGWRKRGEPLGAMRPGHPDSGAKIEIYGYWPNSVRIPARGAERAFLMVTRWSASFKPDELDYVLTFTFGDPNQGPVDSFDAKLRVIERPEEQGCVATDTPFPGLLAILGSGVAAITTRRRLLACQNRKGHACV